jgi:hypothetical protein
MTKIKDGPFQAATEADTTGVIKQELVTYRAVDGKLRKETAFRFFYSDGDYHDTSSVEILAEVN